jgi:hypothetical protein
VKDSNTTDIELFFENGRGLGYDKLYTGLNLDPKIVSISANSGSVAGSIIKAKVVGAGVDTVGLQLVYGVSSTSLCSSLTITSYNNVECKTNAVDLATAVSVGSKLGANEVNNCSTPANCYYDTAISIVNSTTIYDPVTDIATVTGTNFYTTGYTAHAKYLGVEGTVVVVDSSTINITFDYGVPHNLATST